MVNRDWLQISVKYVIKGTSKGLSTKIVLLLVIKSKS